MTDQQPPPTGPGGIGPERYADDRRRYRLDARIATGGMGEVWRGTDTTLGRQVAVKVLKSEYADDATFRSRFATEARHAAALDHPGVAAVYDVGEAQTAGARDGLGDGSGAPRPYLVMELVDGQPLSALLSDGRQSGRSVDREVLRDLLAQSATAIGAAHAAGIIHRDVKPANLLVTRDRRIKITDFGIARAADAAAVTRTGQVMGTPQYLSPEQARGETATPASDVYALGVVAFECLAGRRPFEADSPVATALAHLQQPVPDLPSDVPADLAAVVRTALAKDPGDRFPDGAAFAAALRDPATAVLPAARGAAPPADDGTRVMPAAAGAALGGAGAGDTSTLETQVSDPAPLPVAPGGAGKESDSRSSVLLLMVAGLLVVLLIFFVIFAIGNNDSGTTEPGSGSASDTASASPDPSETASEDSPSQEASPEPSPVTVNENDYVGRPVDDAADALEGLGLGVTRNEVANDGSLTEGQVVAVNPTGEVAAGSTITLSFAGPAPDPSPSQAESPSAPSTSPAASTPAPDPSAPDTEVSPTSSKGKGADTARKDPQDQNKDQGKGEGKGKDKGGKNA